MSRELNLKAFMWAIGVIQPATSEEVKDFIIHILLKQPIAEFDLQLTVDKLLQKGYIRCVSKKNKLYSITHDGDAFLGHRLRALKDKERLYLLKSARDVKLGIKGASGRITSGVSPLKQARTSTKFPPRPEVSLSPGPQPQAQRDLWPRVYWQLNIGSKSEAPLSLPSKSINLNFYSANSIPSKFKDIEHAIVTISELIGVSSYLLKDFFNNTNYYYREFEIPKKSGKGFRVLRAPRTFLKTVQYWILDYFLFRLRQHDSCYSYRKNRSIKDNANVHLNRKYILCVDIESFFDNISMSQVYKCFLTNEMDDNLAELFSRLVTLNDALPQGAPTSPIISNSYLYEFDEYLYNYCSISNLSYSRYADDLTVGSDDYESLKKVEKLIKSELRRFGLKINKNKTRVISSNSCQIVAGVAINNGELRPSRKHRKEVRALFYKAEIENNVELLPQLCGHLNYLKSFKNGDTDNNIKKYQSIIDKIKRKDKTP
ncbi:TPA: retron St85 family RNA-directed DNA polymerase [Vibrio vulnificus]|nr:retron St85 family RNA-directed DNA polymerase [Vibrio vulnificus]HDY8220462.1 retron St85 family RNA-directed DNA polymerase [Vibrio vulnificus]